MKTIQANLVAPLRRTKLFNDFNKGQLLKLTDISIHRKFSKGELIVDEGDKGTSIYCIISGTVKVVKPTSGEEQIVAFLYANDHFGEMSYFTGGARTASVLASDDLEILELPGPKLKKLLKGDHDMELKFLRAIVKLINERLKDTTESLVIETVYME